MNKIKAVGIVGFGGFGKAVAGLLPKKVEVCAYDNNPEVKITGVKKVAELTDLTSCDVIILAIPFKGYKAVLREVLPTLKPDTLIIDVCSIKKASQELLETLLPPNQQYLCVHPLFGPQSLAEHFDELTMVVTKVVGERAERILRFCKEELGVNVKPLSADAHDQEMARVHALTFFVGRALLDMGITESPLKTPYYSKLCALVEVEQGHSIELFRSIQLDNPYAAEVRDQFVSELQKLSMQLAQTSRD